MKNYFLNNENIAEFNSQGFIPLSGQIPKNLLELLDKVASKQTETFYVMHDDELSNVSFTNVKDQRFICRINNLFSYLQPEYLILLGSPQLLDVANSLCGKDALPTYESLMIRTLGDETFTGLHQDMIHDRTSCVPTFCVYLTDASPDDGSVRVIPETQHEKHDLNQFANLFRKNQWNFLNLNAKAGDLLIHDVMTIHDSPALTRRKQRKTIYFEFRSNEHLAQNPLFPNEWIEKRRELVAISRRKYSAFAKGEHFDLTEKEKTFFSTLYSTCIQIEPANYPIVDLHS